MVDGFVNIETRGVSVQELSARVVKDERGKPRLEPMPSTVARWNAVLGRHAEKGPLRLAVSRVSQARSLKQNALLWGCVYPQILEGLRELVLEAGERCPFPDEAALHDALKHRFLGVSVVKVAGEDFELPPTTTRLTIEQFSVYIRAVVEWASTIGIYVEMPEAA